MALEFGELNARKWYETAEKVISNRRLLA